ncbi:MAG: alpha/beta hydrolase [Flavobacteriales bacterium]
MKGWRFIGLVLLVFLWLDEQAAVIDTTAFESEAMHKAIPCVIVTPDHRADSNERYSVIYLLHGYSGNHLSWITIAPSLAQWADEFRVMFVCPDGGYRSWYLDSPVDSTMRYETAIGSELVRWVDAHYPTMADRSGRAISGLSMGGHGGLFLGVRHSDVFGAAGSTSGGVDVRPFTANWDLKRVLGDPSTYRVNWETYTVMNVVDQLDPGELELIVDCGTEDFFLEVNRGLHQKLEKRQIQHTYIESSGKHNGSYWNKSIGPQVKFFVDYFEKTQRDTNK